MSALIPVALALAATGAPATGAPGKCGPEQIGAATVRTWCGPAKATITVGGKTIAIKGGQCSITSSGGLKLFAVNVGRYTVPKAKPKFTSFSASGTDLEPGTYGYWAVSFQTPGRQWTTRASKTTVTITAPGAKKGTFSGSLYEGGKAKGSWSC
jgi:hypothetical protein